MFFALGNAFEFCFLNKLLRSQSFEGNVHLQVRGKRITRQTDRNSVSYPLFGGCDFVEQRQWFKLNDLIFFIYSSLDLVPITAGAVNGELYCTMWSQGQVEQVLDDVPLIGIRAFRHDIVLNEIAICILIKVTFCCAKVFCCSRWSQFLGTQLFLPRAQKPTLHCTVIPVDCKKVAW